jgi:hypothetical protein
VLLAEVIPEVWPKLAVDARADLAPAILAVAAGDAAAACREAAQAALTTLPLPLRSITTPLRALRTSVDAVSVLGAGAAAAVAAWGASEKRRRVADAGECTDAADGTAPLSAPPAVALVRELRCLQSVRDALADDGAASPAETLRVLGEEPGGGVGARAFQVAEVLAAAQAALDAPEGGSEARHVAGAVWQKLLDHALPVLEALQRWPLGGEEAAVHDTHAADAQQDVAALLGSLQVRGWQCFSSALLAVLQWPALHSWQC